MVRRDTWHDAAEMQSIGGNYQRNLLSYEIYKIKIK